MCSCAHTDYLTLIMHSCLLHAPVLMLPQGMRRCESKGYRYKWQQRTGSRGQCSGQPPTESSGQRNLHPGASAVQRPPRRVRSPKCSRRTDDRRAHPRVVKRSCGADLAMSRNSVWRLRHQPRRSLSAPIENGTPPAVQATQFDCSTLLTEQQA